MDKGKKERNLDAYHWKVAVERTLQNDHLDFATSITHRIIASCNENMSYSDLHYEVKPIIRILLNRYARETWPIFSEAIKNAESMKKYYLLDLLSSEDRFDRNLPGPLEDLPLDILHDWYAAEPEFAPELAAGAVEVFTRSDSEWKFSSNAQHLIDQYGHNERVLSALSANMGTFGWSGSIVPHYKNEIHALEPLQQHKIPAVREWAERKIAGLNRAVSKEEQRDAEGDWGIR